MLFFKKMDNREILVKLQYTTKYGVQLNSSRIIKNYNLYKYLVLKNIPEQVYLDYSNEDCELVNLKDLLENSSVVYDKTQIESFNNLKNLLYKDINTQYDLFTLIDNAYNDKFGHVVEKDLAFDKYSYFYKQLLGLSKVVMNKYLQYIGTDEFPKDVNQLFIKELGSDKYNLLIEWLQEPITNDANIINVINNLLNLTGINKALSNKNTLEIPLHKEAKARLNIDVDSLICVKEKVIITKNSSGFYTFKDLIFNIQTSLVIGKWNQQKFTINNLSNEDLEICKYYNLKYDESKVEKKLETPVLVSERNIPVKVEQNVQFEPLVGNIVISETEEKVVNKDSVNQLYEQGKVENIGHSQVMISYLKNLKEKSIIESKLQNNEETSLDDNINKHSSVSANIVDRKKMLETLNSDSTEKNDLTEKSDSAENNETENNETEINTDVLNPYSSTIIPIIDDKVSKGRKKSSIVTVGSTSLKQKAPIIRKTNK